MFRMAFGVRWITTRRRQHGIVIQSDVFAFLIDKLTDQGGFAALARTDQHNDRGVRECGSDALG